MVKTKALGLAISSKGQGIEGSSQVELRSKLREGSDSDHAGPGRSGSI